jgi:hypothetical protein
MDYRPPSFRQPQQYDIPASLDSIFNHYQQMTAQAEQSKLQGIELRNKLGVDPRNMTEEQLDRGFAGPTVTPAKPGSGSFDMGGNQAVPATPEQTTFDRDPHVAAIQRHIQTRRQGESAGVRKNALENTKTEAEIGKLNAEAGKLGREGGAGAIDLKDKAAIEGRLYDDYRNAQPVKNLVLVRDAVRNIAALSKSKTGIADIGIVYSLVKVLDPASAVKEGEITLSQSANPAAQKIADAWNNAKQGRMGNDEKNRQILSAARAIYKETEAGANMERDAVAGRGKQYGIDPEIALPRLGIPQNEFDGMGREEVPLKDARGVTRIGLYEGDKFVGWKQ